MNNRAWLDSQFPFLAQAGKRVVYLDSAATSQKPADVLNAMRQFEETSYANVHRGTYELAEKATLAYEKARQDVAHFIGAKHPEEIVFTRGTTESINLVAHGFTKTLQPGDAIVITALEHHSNLVPWQIACAQTGASLKVVPITDTGEVRLEDYERMLSPKTRLVALAHASNALGTVLPIATMVQMAHAQGAAVLVDGAQWVGHAPVDVQQLDVDFYAFSSHKMYGPTGIGVLYAKKHLLERMPPYQSGGDMIASVTFEKTTYAPIPQRFEAGTPHITGAVGLSHAIAWLQKVGFTALANHEQALLQEATQKLSAIRGLRIVGNAPHKASLISFQLGTMHPHDVASIVASHGVCIRAGHLCAQPVMQRFGVPALARASFGIYNTSKDIDALCEALHHVNQVFYVSN